MTKDNKLKVVFMPGCFDDFEGSQEELDGLVAEINRLAESGELEESAVPIDLDDYNLVDEDSTNETTPTTHSKLLH